MFIFNKYTKPFIFKNRTMAVESLFFNFNYNYKNNIIHSVLFFTSLNFFFYLFNSILYKISFKTFLSFNPFLLFFISGKSLQKITNF